MTMALPDRRVTALADRYSIERELGTGGMATVYLAHDPRHDRKVTVKALKPEPAAVSGGDRFIQALVNWLEVLRNLPGESRGSAVLRTVHHMSSFLALALFAQPTAAQQTGEWIQLFNRSDLSGWIVKIAGHEMGDNFANTFRVEDGILKVSYDGYSTFSEQFGHLFYRQPFSSYHLVMEYHFVGDWLADTPDWARRNSGAMLHSQSPETMRKDQDFPISIEVQLLGGLSDGRPRPTANLCSPGTDVSMNGETVRGHCVNSTSRTYDGDGWVRVEVMVLGDSLIKHIVNGDTVLTYTSPRIGGGNVNGHDPAQKIDGHPLTSGYIALQSEGHPVEFRRVELRVLERD